MSDSECPFFEDCHCPLCEAPLMWGECKVHGMYLPGTNRMMVTVDTDGRL